MPKEKWKRREVKLRKRKLGMQVSGRSIFTLQEIIKKKADQADKATPSKSKKTK